MPFPIHHRSHRNGTEAVPYILISKEEHIMKRTFCLMLALIFLLAPAVSADVLVSPVEMILDSIDLRTVLAAAALVAVGSAVFLWITRKKK